jgi:hypothetical protein
MKIVILGKTWRTKLVTPRTYIKNHTDDSDAITILTDRAIHFRTDCFNIEVIRHELLHAFMEETMMNRASLSPFQVEEIAAEIVGRYAEEIVSLAKDIHNHFSS